uniref:BTB domain-containing protein n=1 Tax=Anopheles melas TaxID=34690 RepID=A0A182U6H8_9DIPT
MASRASQPWNETNAACASILHGVARSRQASTRAPPATGGCVDHICLNADNADVTFIVKGEHLPAHRIILATRSEYFRALLYGGLKESKQNEITLDIPAKAFQYLMKYIYTGRLSLN